MIHHISSQIIRRAAFTPLTLSLNQHKVVLVLFSTDLASVMVSTLWGASPEWHSHPNKIDETICR